MFRHDHDLKTIFSLFREGVEDKLYLLILKSWYFPLVNKAFKIILWTTLKFEVTNKIPVLGYLSSSRIHYDFTFECGEQSLNPVFFSIFAFYFFFHLSSILPGKASAEGRVLRGVPERTAFTDWLCERRSEDYPTGRGWAGRRVTSFPILLLSGVTAKFQQSSERIKKIRTLPCEIRSCLEFDLIVPAELWAGWLWTWNLNLSEGKQNIRREVYRVKTKTSSQVSFDWWWMKPLFQMFIFN